MTITQVNTRVEIHRRYRKIETGTWGLWFSENNSRYGYGERKRYENREKAQEAALKRIEKLKNSRPGPSWASDVEYAVVNVIEHITIEYVEQI